MKNPINILLKQEGTAKASIQYTGLYHNDKPGHEYIEIYTDLVKEQDGIPTTFDPQKPMRIDNTTPVDIVDEQGNPVMADNMVFTGYNTKFVDSGNVDENGQPIYIEVEDKESPIYKNQPVQKKIGEYDKTIWEHFDNRNPASKNIAQAIQEGILRKALNQKIPFLFVQTQAWLETLE